MERDKASSAQPWRFSVGFRITCSLLGRRTIEETRSMMKKLVIGLELFEGQFFEIYR